MIELYPSNGMLELHLHSSLFNGLCVAVFGDRRHSLGASDAHKLDEWAATCENPNGQKADLARAVAGLLRVAGPMLARRPQAKAEDFWSAAAR